MTSPIPSEPSLPVGSVVRFLGARRFLGRPHAVRWIAAAAVLLLSPALWAGFAIDDHFQRLAVERRLAISLAPWDLFRFLPRDPAQSDPLTEVGFGAWWRDPAMQLAYFRPLASLTHFVDYALWPRTAWLMHLENLAWYVGLVVLVGVIYRRLMPVAWTAGLATALYAIDHAHGIPVAWVANRNAIMAASFGVACLLAHDAWRRRAGARFAGIALGAFALALLSAESGLAIGAYLLAYAWHFERGRRAARAWSIAPYAAIAILWRVGYRAAGYGVFASGILRDPILEPGAFLRQALQTLPLLAGSVTFALPTDLLMLFPRSPAGVAVFVGSATAVVTLVLWLTVRKDPVARFFATGAVLATVPFAGSIPEDRYLLWTGIGAMGFLARVLGTLLDQTSGSGGAPARVACAVCVGIRVVLSPVILPLRALSPYVLQDGYRRIADTLPAGPAAAGQTAVIVDAPNDFIGIFVPIVRQASGEPLPEHTYMLAAGLTDITVTRVDPRTIDVRAARGWLPDAADTALRTTPIHVGAAFSLARMHVEVLEVTAGGRASMVRFSFPEALESPSLVFLSWTGRGLAPLRVPAAGETVALPAPPLVLD